MSSFGRVRSVVTTLVFASVIVFAIMQLVPGDPAVVIGGEQASPEQLENIRENLGLNDPVLVQYFNWASSVFRGDLGNSIITGDPVMGSIVRTLPRTLHLVVFGVGLAIVMGVPLGILAALRPDTRTDTVVRAFATSGLAVPNFWLGLMLVGFFALQLGWFPATGFVGVTDGVWQSFRHLLMPSFAIGISVMSAITRQTRSAMMEVMHSDFVRTLTAMGVRRIFVVWQHALRNASIPVLTILGLYINRAIGGTVVIETVFNINGLGRLLVVAVTERDFPMVQGVILVVVVFIVVLNLLVDLTYTRLDPRIAI